MRLVRALVAIVLVGLGLFVLAPSGVALSCLGLSPEGYLSSADSAFVGSVLQVRQDNQIDRVVVKVESWQKGRSPENPITVFDGYGMRWRSGARYQIFASIAPLGFETHPCSGTKELGATGQPVGKSVLPGVFHPLDGPKPAVPIGYGPASIIAVGALLSLGVAVVLASREHADARG